MAHSFGPFDLHRAIGRGGMGEVFLARRRDDPDANVVVLKRIRPEVSRDDEYRKRIKFEAQVASRLNHPNLVKLVEFGRVGECHYIAMEHIEGYSLRRLLEPVIDEEVAPPSPEVGLLIAGGLLDALSTMHCALDETGVERPILHRDVTPANVIIARDGHPVLIDFGIAKDVFGPAITQIGRVIGTARYMAPEHRMGEYADARADVFSASMILFELVVGRRPWPSLAPHKEMLRVVFDAPEVDDVDTARVPQDVLTVLNRGLSCRAEERWSDARSMLAALQDTGAYRALDSGGDRWAPVRDWAESSGLAYDGDLDDLVVDHAPSTHAPADIAGMVWNSAGQLAQTPEPVRASDVPHGRVLTIPPLPPRRDRGVDTLELASAAVAHRRPWGLIGLGLLALIGIFMGYFLGTAA